MQGSFSNHTGEKVLYFLTGKKVFVQQRELKRSLKRRLFSSILQMKKKKNNNNNNNKNTMVTCAVDAPSSNARVNNLRSVKKRNSSYCSITVSCANVGECAIRTGHLRLSAITLLYIIIHDKAKVTCRWVDSCGNIMVR